jgi:triphosphoribosyl-dephospho-CoA synthase
MTDAAPSAATSVKLSIGQCGTLACLLEISAPKPGNVHRGADFADMTYLDMVAGAVAIAPALQDAAAAGRLGRCVLDAVLATRSVTATNTNLGTLLLLAPLAMPRRDEPLRTGVARVLQDLDAEDARQVYEAIRVAQPGGLGKVEEADVSGPPPRDLLAAMRLAADRDLVARQYIDGFAEVLDLVLPWLREGLARGWSLAEVIVYVQMRTMSRFPDSLISRKCGATVAQQAAAMASDVLAAGSPGDEAYQRGLLDLDFWLRADGHRRNPGTTADLIAGGLFAALRDGIIGFPLRFYS